MSFVDDIQTSPPWQKAVLAILAVVICLGLLKNYVLKDKPLQIKQLKHKIRMIEGDINNQRILAGDYELMLKKHADFQAEISKKLPSLKDALNIIGSLISTAGTREINITLVQPGELIDESLYWLLPLDLQVQGSLSGLTSFIKLIEGDALQSYYKTLDINSIGQGQYQANISLQVMAAKGKADSLKPSMPLVVPIPETIVKKPSSVAAVSGPALVVNGFWGGTQQGVFINDKLVFIGDDIDGYKVAEINSEKDTVTLIKGNTKRVLTMKK
ncbi:MAG: type 4a pilus biogenesis protein PilO [Candidatus Margulisiibacteriota bacterium]